MRSPGPCLEEDVLTDIQDLLPKDRVVYMCLKSGGPLYHKDMPVVFGDAADAFDALDAGGDESADVAELDLETVVKRLEAAGVEYVYYQPPGLQPARRLPLGLLNY